ncbi:MAG: tRNA lysidine(34) synthetase TilS [Tissierellia bacterium]|nr:tRNA lysidine(34) synthetase TilS [Tissierellia bacterium]
MIAVSGGADSMYLLHHLIEIKDSYQLSLRVAHYNHGIRETAKRDEDFVREYCKKFHIPFYCEQGNMREFGKRHKLSEEEAGRILRYRFFRSIIKPGEKIATAHNADDQAETLLFRILRGTGIEGLCGIPEVTEDIIRPILSIRRKDIESYLEKHKIPYQMDETNLTPDYGRNKIRLELIPYLEENYNPKVTEALLRLQSTAEKYRNFTQYQLEKIPKETFQNPLSIPTLQKLDPLLCREGIKKMLQREAPEVELATYDNIESIIELFYRRTGASIDLGSNYSIRRSYDRLILEHKDEDAPLSTKIFLTTSYTETEMGDFLIRKGKGPTDRFKILIDGDKIKGHLYLRHRKPGDIFRPLGLTGHKKVKDYFIDEKIDRSLRDKILLLCDEEKIIWIVGYRLSEDYKIDEGTKNYLYVEAKNVGY